MPADATIFHQYLQAPKSVMDYQTEYDQRDALRTRNALQALALQQQNDQVQQGLAERNALRRIAASNPDSDSFLKALDSSGMPGLMDIAAKKREGAAKLAESQSVAAKNNAEAGSKTQADAIKARQDAYAEAAALNTPEDAIAALNRAVAAGKVPMQVVPGFQRMVTTDPLWKLKLLQGALDPEKLKEALMPHMTAAGGALVNTNPMAGPTGQGQPNAIPITQSADNAATQATSRANNAATIAAENQRAAASRGTQLQIHGLNPDGTPSADTAALVDQIGKYQVKPPSGFALNNPRMQSVMAQVAAKYPQFDATQFDQRQKAARDFGTGKQGQTAQSLNVAIDHLAALQEAADALKNGDVQLLNKVGNYIATQTGKPAPTNFEATKQIVADEVVKAVVGAGGSMHDREQAAKVISAAGSPAQLAGVIQQYTSLMGGQLHGLRQTYKRTTGYDDFDNKFLTENTRAALERTPAGKPTTTASGATASNW
jgi:hypothetical protein